MAPNTFASPDQFADYLIKGYWQAQGSMARKWSTATVTYSFGSGWTESQKLATAAAFGTWSDVANIKFSEVASGGQILMRKGTDGKAWSSSSFYSSPTGTASIVSGRISIDTKVACWSDLSSHGKYGYFTLIHEMGHAIGLGHPGPYNGSASYSANAIFTNDTRQYSAMSYFGANNSGANHGGAYGSTALVYDIYAAQKIYGANMTTRTGNTTYGFNSNAGKDEFNFSKNRKPVVAIWDAGGNDTLDLSGFSAASRIDLAPGAFTDAGGLTRNIAIAFGTTIENAVGGSGNDVIFGNAANNTVTGGAGNDTIDGVAGVNTAVFSGKAAEYGIATSNGVTTVTDTTSGRDGIDTLKNVQFFKFSDKTIQLGAVESGAAGTAQTPPSPTTEPVTNPTSTPTPPSPSELFMAKMAQFWKVPAAASGSTRSQPAAVPALSAVTAMAQTMGAFGRSGSAQAHALVGRNSLMADHGRGFLAASIG